MLINNSIKDKEGKILKNYIRLGFVFSFLIFFTFYTSSYAVTLTNDTDPTGTEYLYKQIRNSGKNDEHTVFLLAKKVQENIYDASLFLKNKNDAALMLDIEYLCSSEEFNYLDCGIFFMDKNYEKYNNIPILPIKNGEVF